MERDGYLEQCNVCRTDRFELTRETTQSFTFLVAILTQKIMNPFIYSHLCLQALIWVNLTRFFFFKPGIYKRIKRMKYSGSIYLIFFNVIGYIFCQVTCL